MYDLTQEKIERIKAEHGIPSDWVREAYSGDFRLIRSWGSLCMELRETNSTKPDDYIRIVDQNTAWYEVPEGSEIVVFVSPDKERRMMVLASPKDRKSGTDTYLGQLNIDQLIYARAHADKLIEAKNAEEKRVVWRVWDDVFCRGNFREDDYAGAVACMAKEALRLAEEHKDRPRKLSVEVVPERVIASEYEEFFK